MISVTQGTNRLKDSQEAELSGKQMNLQQSMKMKTIQSLQASWSCQQLHHSPIHIFGLIFHSCLNFKLCTHFVPWVDLKSATSPCVEPWPLQAGIVASVNKLVFVPLFSSDFSYTSYQMKLSKNIFSSPNLNSRTSCCNVRIQFLSNYQFNFRSKCRFFFPV